LGVTPLVLVEGGETSVAATVSWDSLLRDGSISAVIHGQIGCPRFETLNSKWGDDQIEAPEWWLDFPLATPMDARNHTYRDQATMGDMTIHDACRLGDIDAVGAMIDVDPAVVDADDEHSWRPIFHAALWQHEPVVRLLIRSGADLAAHDGYALHYAGEVANNKSIVALLVQYGALDAHVRPTCDLSRQLLAALFLGDVDRVRSLLIRHPHLASTPDGRGDHPIHHAARNGDARIVRLLIEHGADVNAVTDHGHTVLYCAGGHGHLETLQLLLQRGADCKVKFTQDGKTLLDWLDQYPGDERFTLIADALRQHQAF